MTSLCELYKSAILLPLCSTLRKSLAFFVSNAYRTYPSEQNEWGTSRRRRVQNSSVLYIFRDFCRNSILHVLVNRLTLQSDIHHKEFWRPSVPCIHYSTRFSSVEAAINFEQRGLDVREGGCAPEIKLKFWAKATPPPLLFRAPSLPLFPSSWWSDGRRKINFQSWPRRFPLWANGYARMDGRIDGMWSSEHHENMAESDQTFSHVLEPSFSTIHASRTSTENVRCLREMALLFHINR